MLRAHHRDLVVPGVLGDCAEEIDADGRLDAVTALARVADSLMIDVLFPPVPADDEVERAARHRALVALREAARDARAGAARDGAARGSPPPASAAQLLTRAADAAEGAPAPGALGPGQYLYVARTAMEPKKITRGGETFTVFIRYLDEDWTARDGSGRSRHQPIPPTFPTREDRAAWKRAGSPSARKMLGNYLPIVGSTDVRDKGRPGRAFPARSTFGMSYRAVRALPTDPALLEAKLLARLRPGRNFRPKSSELMTRVQLLERVGQLLAGTPLDAAQRAALCRKGTAVKLAGTIALDGSVRPEYEGIRVHRGTVIVFDPGTGALLGTRHTLNDDVDQGAVDTTQVRDALK